MDIVPSPFSSSLDIKPPFLVPIVPCLQIFTQLSPSSPEALSGTFNITEGYIELASDPITDRNDCTKLKYRHYGSSSRERSWISGEIHRERWHQLVLQPTRLQRVLPFPLDAAREPGSVLQPCRQYDHDETHSAHTWFAAPSNLLRVTAMAVVPEPSSFGLLSPPPPSWACRAEEYGGDAACKVQFRDCSWLVHIGQ
ncbi:hypothetical protein BKA56DRAFT_620612 [Ilyonectria sp. MPI-CAGE-AT-0026]|nr:hypothetical protein BKA56DRAFT_620612 [Ilyonectria sp. MPI-CAGE-AT-0026]